MLQKTIMCLMILYYGLVYSQSAITMRGNISAKGNPSDTINFNCGLVNKYYYETNTLSAEIINNEFSVNFNLSYPHMYALILNSEKRKGVSINDFTFLDNTTTEIKFDSNSKLETSNGISNTEYLKIFTPYMLKGKKENLNFYLFNNHELDTNLLGYIKKYSDSYVALWYLIQKLSISGYSELYEKSLNSFSKKIKSEKLWKTALLEFSNVKIKENNKFPELDLKNVDLNQEKLILPKAEYTLIDYWFSRCKPCLEQLPSLIEIYNKNKNKGFNVIGISVDQTENVILFWQKRIIENGIPWKNYLDENGTIATQEKIISFPSNFLLNNKGEVIKKNVSLEELEKLLDEKLK
jgi:thiol-disulfide isomerase/thioredoxin